MAQSINTFAELNSDFHPVNTQPNVLTDAINATLTTGGENQLILQNQQGTDIQTELTPEFIPLGVGVFNNIAYIVSGRFDNNGDFIEGEIGTYPSPDWTQLQNNFSNAPDFSAPLVYSYSPLRNFSTSTVNSVLDDDINYFESFRTSKLNLVRDHLIEVELQPSYDGSVNIIFTDDRNPIRLVNSRFIVDDSGKNAKLGDRRQTKDTNTYSESRFGATRLLKQSDKIADLTFNGLVTGGSWKGGGYRIYFKYTDSDGSLTDIIEESRLVSIAYDDHGATMNESCGKAMSFTISNIDRKFSGIKVYYSYASGETDTTTEIREITNIFDIDSDSINIILYGTEDSIIISQDLLNNTFSSISTVKTMAQHDDSLILANIGEFSQDFTVFESLAQDLFIEEVSEALEIKTLGSGYADPDNIYFNLGYWGNETYELGIVWVLTEGRGNTPVFPIRGADNSDGLTSYTYTGGAPGPDGFLPGGSSQTENTLGAYRTSKRRDLLTGANETETEIKLLSVNIASLKTNSFLQANTLGFFFVRKQRKKDCLIQGYITNTTREPVTPKVALTDFYEFDTTSNTWKENYHHITDVRFGIGIDTAPSGEYNTKILPAPGRIWETTFHSGSVKKEKGNSISMQGIVKPDPSIVTDSSGNYIDMYYAFYGADLLTDPKLFASIFNGSAKGIMVNELGATRMYQELAPNTTFQQATTLGTLNTYTVTNAGTLPGTFTIELVGSFSSFTLPGGTTRQLSFYISIRNEFGVYQIENVPVIITVNLLGAYISGGIQSTSFTTGNNISQAGSVASVNFTNGSGTNVFQILINNIELVSQTGATTTLPISATASSATTRSSSINTNSSIIYTGTSSDSPITALTASGFSFNPVSLETIPRKNYFQFIGTGQEAYSDSQFSSVSDRNLYYVTRAKQESTGKDKPWDRSDWNFHPVTTTVSGEVGGLYITNNQFSEYVGLRMTAKDQRIINALRNDDLNVFNINLHPSNGYGLTGQDLYDYVYGVQEREINFGIIANIYENEAGAMSKAEWKNKYANTSFDEPYFAISKRYSWDDPTLPNSIRLADGDCYINYTYKRVMYGLGIPGIPTATDPSLYVDGNRDTGLYPKGFVFPIITENNYNTALRTFDFHEATEKILYGKDRSFYPIDNINSLRSSRQPESTGYNHGYDYDGSDVEYNSLNDRAPSLQLSYGNRLMVSAANVETSFVNGYSDFSGLNFRDYNKQLGEVTKLISHDNNLYCIFENGIGLVPINQRTMVSEQEGGIFIDNAQVLGQKMYVITSEYGSDQQFSVIKTENAVYGCDLNKNKIWRITSVATKSGSTAPKLEAISDFKVQTFLKAYKNRIQGNDHLPIVKANYDRDRNHVIFSYLNIVDGPTYSIGADKHNYSADNFNVEVRSSYVSTLPAPTSAPGLTDEQRFIERTEYINAVLQDKKDFIPSVTILDKKPNKIASIFFDESLVNWRSRLSWNPIWAFNIGNDLFSFNALGDEQTLWKHFSTTEPYCKIYGNQEKFVFEFILVDNPSVQKILNNMLFICNRTFPGRITYSLIEQDVDYETFDNADNGYTELMKQRTEVEASVGWNITTNVLGGLAYMTIQDISKEESERLQGGYIVYQGVLYIIGASLEVLAGSTSIFYNAVLNQNGIHIAGALPTGWSFNTIEFGIIKQNMEYLEDHLDVEVGNDMDKSLIRDKAIRVRVIYEGYDYVTIQNVISSFQYSFG